MHKPDDTAFSQEFLLADESATLALGAALATALAPGLVIELEGDLGAGKTTLTRGILRGLGFAGRVKSPTYTLVEPYTISNLYLYHFDLYRFNDPEEWEDAGFREHFNPDSVCLIEWADKAAGLLPQPDWRITLVPEGTGRRARLDVFSEQGKACATRVSLHSPMN
ncbi:tRNA (adenosine(37)-N6)-threonylcarbamoyltransferase complex ATPase subunit type 1 TsaE [Chitinilyticum aquatile]|uniref:tRNA (adenosine(37)-N6)-threonylcarbamoyltransferase complex ATPase subunit type 1 TsaE n=1 Tax=Chitinilyticum aquatile TaxID=362520 RepID=UPI00041CC617|nr:tRNA (adenosine(37)-N6)-threonylcarbamoyltransferase complex ATPase subunit type 1 TsaE [Chitinilyticum aquatile]